MGRGQSRRLTTESHFLDEGSLATQLFFLCSFGIAHMFILGACVYFIKQ